MHYFQLLISGILVASLMAIFNKGKLS